MKPVARARRLLSAASARLSTLPRSAFLVLVLVTVAGTAAGSIFAYRTYDFVQHDNDFCVSCHLMEDPARRFAESRHRDLSCKKCHQPTNIQRAKMGLRQIIVQPEEIEAHADVPEARCTACHVDGDPGESPIVDRFRGHLVHRADAGPALSDVTCTTCHSEGLHDFSASDRSCTAAGCHRDALIRLGDMGDLSLHCVACHDFSQPGNRILDGPEGQELPGPGALTPGSETCLSCHDMREKIDIDPDTEPHEAVCGTCHNAHDQARPADALATCTTAGCHDAPDEIDDDHHRWDAIELDDCVQCHEAHTFEVDGEDCLACHDDILGPPPRIRGGDAPEPQPAASLAPTPAGRALWAHAGPAFPEEHAGARGPAPGDDGGIRAPWTPAVLQQVPDTAFTHDRHRRVECRSCHTSGESIVPDLSRAWCTGCHHEGRTRRECTTCHDLGGLPDRERTTVFRLPGGAEPRGVLFPHDLHEEQEECSACHGDPPTAVERDFTCVTCHDEHHAIEAGDCLACHDDPPVWAHDEVVVHDTCAGGVCHQRFPPEALVAPASWTRATCLACHPDFTGREPFPDLPPRSSDVSGKPLHPGP